MKRRSNPNSTTANKTYDLKDNGKGVAMLMWWQLVIALESVAIIFMGLYIFGFHKLRSEEEEKEHKWRQRFNLIEGEWIPRR